MYDELRKKLQSGIENLRKFPISELFAPTSSQNQSFGINASLKEGLKQLGGLMQRVPEVDLTRNRRFADRFEEERPDENTFQSTFRQQEAQKMRFASDVTERVSGFVKEELNRRGKGFQKIGTGEKLDFWDYMDLSDYYSFGASSLLAGSLKPVVKQGTERLSKEVLEASARRTGTGVLDEIYQGFDTARKAKNPKTGPGVRTQLIDKFSPLFDLVKQAKTEIAATDNPYKRIRLLSGMGGKVEAIMNNNLAPILQKESKRLDDLSALLVLQREDELISRGLKRARTSDEVKDGLLELYGKYGQEGFQTLKDSADDIRKFGQSMLRELFNAGIIDRKTYKTIQAQNQFYVPFEAVSHIADNLERGIYHKSYNVASQNVLREIGESTSQVADPIESLVKKIPQVLSLTERNKALQTLTHLPELDDTFKDLIFKIEPVKTQIQRVSKKTGKIFETTVKKNKSIPSGFGVINVFEDGKNVRYAVPQEIEGAIKHLDAETGNILVSMLSPFAKLLRAGATGLNIGFIPANIVRDISDALLTETTENGIKGVAGLIGSYPRALASAFFKGKLYNEWLQAGGAQSTLTSQVFKKAPQTLADLSGRGSKLKMVLDTPRALINFVNRVGEESTRLARYSSGIKRGEGAVEAAFKSRDITLDFAKSGNILKTLNQVVPFLNAGVQGSEKVMRLYKTNPARALYYSAILYGVPSIMLYRHNSQFKDFEDVPKQELDTNWVFMTRDRTPEEVAEGEKIHGFKVPKGFMGRPVAALTDSFLDFLKNKDPQAFTEFLANTGEEFSPIGLPVSSERLGRSISKIEPSLLTTAIEGITNKDLYFGNKIVPTKLEDVEAEEQYTDETAELTKKLGAILNISPLKIENAVQNMTGGLGQQALDLFSGDVEGALVEPITKRFIGIRTGENLDDEFEKVAKYQEESKTASLKRQRQAEELYQEWSQLPKSEANKKTFELKKEDPLLYQKLKDVIADNKLGLTSLERFIKSLPVQDETRATYIFDRLNELDSRDKQLELIKLWKQKGIISKEVYSQLLEMKKQSGNSLSDYRI